MIGGFGISPLDALEALGGAIADFPASGPFMGPPPRAAAAAVVNEAEAAKQRARAASEKARSSGQPLTSPPDNEPADQSVIPSLSEILTPPKPPEPRTGMVQGSAGTVYVPRERPPMAGAGRHLVPPTIPAPVDTRPYSEKVGELQATMPAIDVKKPGGWSFAGGYAETGKRGGREGRGTLSGLEQATSRRTYLEGRQKEEQAREQEMGAAELGRTGIEQQIALARARTADPFAEARIKAQGQYGGALYAAEAKNVGVQRALAVLSMYQEEMDKAREALAVAPAGSPQAEQLRAHLKYLQDTALQAANIAMGERASNPQQDILSSVFGVAGGGGAATTPTPPR